MKSLNQISKDPAFWTVNGNRKRVKPFPGREPTRWRIEVQMRLPKKDGQLFADYKTVWTYYGKPNPLLIPKIVRFYQLQGSVIAVEYDQLGAFRFTHQVTPRKALMIQYYSPGPSYFYAPWSKLVEDFFDPWRTPLFAKLIEHENHRFFIHSPWEKMDDAAGIENLRSYRAWLRKENPWKQLI